MALEIHTVELRAKDSMSPVFRKVGDSANQSARQVTDSFARAGESTRRFNVAAAAMGTAIGASVGILADFSRAAAEDAAGQARLQQAIENTGKSYDEYSDSVDKAIKKGQEKAFSDDATREALVRLTSVTGDAGKSLDQLGLVMDFARARGISLADSATVIGKVMGGNVGILQRYGIAIEDGATATEALALIQARSAGQADVYANSQLGQLDRMKDKWGELQESIGASTGELQQFLMLLPGLSAGMTAISALAGGIGGAGMLAGGLVAANAAALYLVYDAYNGSPQAGGDYADKVFGTAGAAGANILKTVTPGSTGDSFFDRYANQWQGVLDDNQIESMFAQMFFGVSSTKDVARIVSDIVASGGFSGFDGFDSIPKLAASNYMTTAEYVKKQAEIGGYTYDAGTNQFMSKTQVLGRRFRDNGGYGNVGAGLSYTPDVSPDVYMSPAYKSAAAMQGGMTRLGQGSVRNAPANQFIDSGMSDIQGGMTQMGQQSVQIAENATKALQAQYGAYSVLFDGITKASDATAAFNAVQAGLSTEMSVYQGQASEWNSELQAQDAAYEILQQRQADGVKLTKEQTDFLNNYTKATEIGTGAVEDSTVAAGIAAQNMLLNKNAMDEWKAGTGELTDTILLLIEALGGVPDSVRTQITLDGADEFERQLNAAINHLNAVDGQTATFYINTKQTGVSIGNPNGPSIDNNQRHGGFFGARHGSVLGNGYTLVGEDGPELIAGGARRGGMVIPAGATRAKMRDQQGGGITITGPITVIANDPMQFQQQLRSSSVMEARW